MLDTGASGEWSAAQTDYILRAAKQSARALDLYYNVLQRVALGTLTPTAIRDTLTRFSESYGSAYATKLGELSARFFSGLMQITTGGSDAPPPFDASNPAAWFTRLAEYTNANSRRAVRSYQVDVERVAAGEVTPDELQREIAGEYSRRTSGQLREIGQLYFELLRNLTEMNGAFEDEYFRRLMTAADPSLADAPVLHLTAPLGELTSAELTFENTRADRTVIRCLATDVRRADGVGPAFAPAITLDPDGLLLEPGQEGRVRVSLALEAGRYDPRHLYVGAIQVLRHGDARLDIPVNIIATDPLAADETAKSDGQRVQHGAA